MTTKPTDGAAVKGPNYGPHVTVSELVQSHDCSE